MPAKKKDYARILPTPTTDAPTADNPYPAYPAYKHGRGWRFITVAANGTESPSDTFPTRKQCAEARQAAQKVIDGVADVSVGEALDAYEVVLRSERENRPNSVYQTMRKLATMFPDREEMLEALTPERCEALYLDLRTRPAPRTGKPYATDYHRNALAESRTFLRWCVKKKYIPTCNMEDVEGVGRRRKGKPQLRIDEARRWLDTAHRFASVKGEEGAVAAMITMLMGLRADSIVKRKVRDLDDNGTRLFVEESKTITSDGWHEVPEELQGYLRALCTGKQPGDSLWNDTHWRDWPTAWVEKICKASNCPRVTAHGMRAFFISMDHLGGRKVEEAATMARAGHTSFEVTRGYTVGSDAITKATARRVMKVLKGGK